MKVIIAAAGTGGHINPGIAIANKICKEQTSQVIFIGTPRGLENDLVPRAGYELKTIDAYGINRKFSFENLKRLFRSYKSIKDAKKIIQEFRPNIVIGTGGYICGPVFLAARKCGLPTILHESNAFPGVAVKFLSKKVDSILLGFSDAKIRIKNCKRVIVTGTPTRVKKMELFEFEKISIKEDLGYSTDKPIVLVFGGSQGAKSINDSIIGILKEKLNQDYQIIWATGTGQFDEIKEELDNNGININNIKNAKIVPYIYEMEKVLNIADLVISRSGAMTITEISKVGIPAIFIPFPHATENHQEYNARVLENVGAAKVILDKDLNKDILSNTINDLISDNKKLKLMGEKATTISIESVEDKIYSEIKRLVR